MAARFIAVSAIRLFIASASDAIADAAVIMVALVLAVSSTTHAGGDAASNDNVSNEHLVSD